MKKLVRLIKSTNGCVYKQKANLISLKLRKIGDSVIIDANKDMLGRVKKIRHLIVLEDVCI